MLKELSVKSLVTIFTQWEQSICAKKESASGKKKGKSQSGSEDRQTSATLSECDEKFLEFITLIKKARLSASKDFLSINEVCVIINDFKVWIALSSASLGRHVAIMSEFIENYSVYEKTRDFINEIAGGMPLMFGGDYDFSLTIKNLLDDHYNLYAVFSRLLSLLQAKFSISEIERMNQSKPSRKYEDLVMHFVPSFLHMSSSYKEKYEKMSYFFDDIYRRHIADILKEQFSYSKNQVNAITSMLEYIYDSQFDNAIPTPPPEPTVTDRVLRNASALFSAASGYVVLDHAESNRAIAVDFIFAILSNPEKSLDAIIKHQPEKFSIDSIKSQQGILASHDVKPSRLIIALEGIKPWGESDLEVNVDDLKHALEDYFCDTSGAKLASGLSDMVSHQQPAMNL